MSSFLDSKEQVMEIVLTQKGRQKLAQGKLNIKYYSFHDDEIDYQAQYAARPFVESLLPVNSVAPVLGGTISIGQNLSITAGTWSGSPTLTYTLMRGAVEVLTAVSEATIEAYALLAADIGPILYVTEIATNGAGSGTEDSNTLQYTLLTTNGVGDYNADVGVIETSGRVSTWEDQFLSNDLTQGTANNRPVLSAAGGPNGHNAVDFTLNGGVSTQMANSDIGLGTAAVTVYTVGQSPASGRYFCDGVVNNSRVITNNVSFIRMYAGAFGPSVTAPADGTWIVDAAVFNGASSKQSIDGGTDATGNVGGTTSPGHTIGGIATPNATQCLNAKIARQIIYTGAHSDSVRADITAYLMWWAGI